jgi:hypothetical protein
LCYIQFTPAASATAALEPSLIALVNVTLAALVNLNNFKPPDIILGAAFQLLLKLVQRGT